MYCPSCGNEQDSAHNYCQHDGTSLYTKVKEKSITAVQNAYCNSCSSAVPPNDQYCISCGTFALHTQLETASHKVEKANKNISAVLSEQFNKVSLTWDRDTILESLKIGAIIAVIPFAAIFFISLLIFSQVRTALEAEFGMGGLEATDSLFRVTDIFAVLHGAGLRLGEGGVQQFFFQAGIVPGLVLLSLTACISALYLRKFESVKSTPVLLTALSSGFVYAVLLIAVLLIGTRNVTMDAGLFDMAFSVSYHTFTAAFLSFLLVFFTVSFVLHFTGDLKSIEAKILAVHPLCITAVPTAVAFSGVLFFVTGAVFIYAGGFQSEWIDIGAMAPSLGLMTVLQLGALMVPLSNVQTVQAVVSSSLATEGSQSFWIFTNLEQLGMEAGMMGAVPAFPAMLQATILIPILLLAFAGAYIRRRHPQNFLKPVLAAGGFYTLYTLLWSFYFQMDMMAGGQTISLSIGFITSAAATYVLSVCALYTGAFFKKV